MYQVSALLPSPHSRLPPFFIPHTTSSLSAIPNPLTPKPNILGHPRMSKLSSTPLKTTKRRWGTLPEISTDVEHDRNSGYGTAQPTIGRRGHSAPAALKHIVPQRQKSPDNPHHIGRVPPPSSSSLPVSMSQSAPPLSSQSGLHRRAIPALGPNTCIQLPQITDVNIRAQNQNERQSRRSSLSALPSGWREDLQPLLPPPHTYGRPIPLPPVGDIDILPVEYTDFRSPVAGPYIKTARFVPLDLPRTTATRGDRDLAEYGQCPFPTSNTSRAQTNLDSGIFNLHAFCDCDITSPDSYLFYDDGNPRCPGDDEAHLGRIEKWRRSVR